MAGSDLLWRQNEIVRRYAATHPDMAASMRLRKTDAWGFTVGSTHSWYATNFVTNTEYSVPSTCRAVGVHCYIFVEDASWGSSVTQTAVDSVTAAFDLRTPANALKGVFQMDVEAFGNPPDVDGDPRIVILILDIQDGFTGSGGFVAGYFYSLNETTMPNSNQAEIYYLDCNPTSLTTPSGLQDAMSTTAHEFQHMIHWNYDQNEITFVNEGCSLVAEVNCGYPIFDQSGYVNETNHYLLDWRSGDNTAVLIDYSRAARFFTYLRDQAGMGVFKPLVASTAHGIAGIDAGLAGDGVTQRFSDLFATWPVANILDDTTVDRSYGYVYPNLPKARGTEYFSPNVAATTDTVAPLAVQYLVFRNGANLQVSFSNAGSGFVIDAIEKGATNRVVSVSPGVQFSEPGFGTTYTEIDFAAINTDQSLPETFTFQAQGSGSSTVDLQWDATEPTGYLGLSPLDTVCVTFDGVTGGRLDSIRVALRRAGTMTGGVWQSTGVERPTPLGAPLASPITASIGTTPGIPYPVPWPNWATVDLRPYGIDAGSPFVAGFVCQGDPSVQPRVMVTEYASSDPYHSYTYMHSPTSGTPGWYYLTSNDAGDSIYIYLIRAYVSFAQALTVYPGDANDDGVVDAQDILPIGRYYGKTGFSRSGGATWAPQPVQPWSVADASYADCDGNGRVDADDIKPIIANWGQVRGASARLTVNREAVCQDLLGELDAASSGNAQGDLRKAILAYMTDQLGIPGTFSLEQNYPNPFNPSTTIRFNLPDQVSRAAIEIFDVLGRLVWEKSLAGLEPGSHTVRWDGINQQGEAVGTGVYFYRLSAGTSSAVRKLMLLR